MKKSSPPSLCKRDVLFATFVNLSVQFLISKHVVFFLPKSKFMFINLRSLNWEELFFSSKRPSIMPNFRSFKPSCSISQCWASCTPLRTGTYSGRLTDTTLSNHYNADNNKELLNSSSWQWLCSSAQLSYFFPVTLIVKSFFFLNSYCFIFLFPASVSCWRSLWTHVFINVYLFIGLDATKTVFCMFISLQRPT